jgi:hypothetical protein
MQEVRFVVVRDDDREFVSAWDTSQDGSTVREIVVANSDTMANTKNIFVRRTNSTLVGIDEAWVIVPTERIKTMHVHAREVEEV